MGGIPHPGKKSEMSTQTVARHWDHCARNNSLMSALTTPSCEGVWGVDVASPPGGPGHSPARLRDVQLPRAQETLINWHAFLAGQEGLGSGVYSFDYL